MKRTTAILLCILLLIPVLALTVSADTSYVFEIRYVEAFDDWYLVYPGTLPDGEYNLTFQGAAFSLLSKEPLSVEFTWMESEDMQAPVFVGTTTLVQFPSEFTVDLTLVQFGGHTYLMGETAAAGDLQRVVFSGPGSDNAPVASVSDSLNTAIEWVGTVTTSLLSGELNSLLLLAAIPIAISLVLLTVKIIKKNSWGV